MVIHKWYPTLILCFVLLVANVSVQAQELRENEKGEKIIVWEDGSWQYFSDYGSDDPNTFHYPGEDVRKKLPTFTGKVDPLDGAIPITEADIQKIAIRKAQLANEAAGITQNRAKQATQNRITIEKELAVARQSPDSDSETIRKINIRLDAARRVEEAAIREAHEAQRESQAADQLTRKGAYVKVFQEERAARRRGENTSSEYKLASEQSYSDIIPLAENYDYQPKRENLLINPPDETCKIVFVGKDERTGGRRRDVKKSFLFSYTDDRLRPYLKNKEYLRCEGFLTSLDGGYRYLTLEFTFAYPNAREAYGFIEEGSILTLRLLNGNFVNLFSGEMERGSYNTKTEELTYSVYYPIDNSQLKLLKNGELDAIRVFWSTGFEEYEVYQLDFFINQLHCLEQ